MFGFVYSSIGLYHVSLTNGLAWFQEILRCDVCFLCAPVVLRHEFSTLCALWCVLMQEVLVL